MLSETYLLRPSDLQRRVLPQIAARYHMSTAAFILAAIDSAIRTCADNDPGAQEILAAVGEPTPRPVFA